jgi:hypothetical protein
MTVVVGFHCSDGAVIAADSMITPSMGNTAVGHHKGQKVFVLPGEKIFAFSGDQGLAMRALYAVEQYTAAAADTMQYAIGIWQGFNAELGKTGFQLATWNPNLNTLVAFTYNNAHQLCLFGSGGHYLPMLLGPGNYFVSLGSGKQFADPFLRFVVDTFCTGGPPTVADARFYVTWVVQHVIETNPGGVAGPIRMAVLSRNDKGQYSAAEIPSDDVQEHLEAVAEAGQVLRDWRAGTLAQPPTPEPPPTPPTPPASA